MAAAVADVAVPFLSFLYSSIAASLLASQTFSPRLTTLRHLSLSRARYSKQLGVTLKDFMETFSVSVKCFFWPPWERLRRRAFSSEGGDLSYGQHDRPNEAVIASIWCRCLEEKPELKLWCLVCFFFSYLYIYMGNYNFTFFVTVHFYKFHVSPM